jgi:hypothetical protein
MSAKPTDTRQNLLNFATDLVERLGYNAFSYRDLADATNLTTAISGRTVASTAFTTTRTTALGRIAKRKTHLS